MLTQSIYTHIFQRNGKLFLYNSMTTLFAEITEELYEVLFNRDYAKLPDSLCKDLLDKGIICEESDLYTYYNTCLVKFNGTSFNPHVCNLVIVPTLGCNFDCPYCFESNKVPKRMDKTIQDKIISHLENSKDFKKVNITWYGGEPLMAFDIISELYARIAALAGIEIGEHSIITNGFLITDRIIEFINTCKVNSIQITLDGVKDHHDKTRFLKESGKPTFETIKKNINRILNECHDTTLNIRINTNKDNIDDFGILFKQMSEGCISDRLYIYPGFIRTETADKCSLCYNTLSRDSAFDFYKDLRNKGINIDFIPRKVNSKGCMMHQINSIIVGPDGEIYKCWNDVGNIDKVTGHIGENKIENSSLFFHMMAEASPFSDYRCKDCLQFPTCSGGCGWYRSRNIRENGRFDVCPIHKDTRILEDALILSLRKDGKLSKQTIPMI